MAEEIEKYFKGNNTNSIYILGSGPNGATAELASLILGKASQRPIVGMSLSHYEYMFHEHSKDQLTIIINDNGPSKGINANFIEKMNAEGSRCIFIEEIDLHGCFPQLI